MNLRHLHLPGITSYIKAGRLQEKLVATLLAHKADPTSIPTPPPTVVTAQFFPVYTCGRREIGTIDPDQRAFLASTGADFHESLRGGQTTFHGPGQLVAYPVIDLRRHKLSPRYYICTLEKAVIKLCSQYGLTATRTDNPGVWVTEDRKLAAVGVHLRRNVTSHGIGLNVSTDLRWFEQIVACGLEGKKTTSLVQEGLEQRSVDEVAQDFVQVLADSLHGVTGIDKSIVD